jgi:nicotinate-nucleotide adenylyltransferase
MFTRIRPRSLRVPATDVPAYPSNGADRRAMRVGLMGGSFNPAHEGHRFIARLALRQLGLDEVWWLVSPQNPLKSRDGMAPFAERLASAHAIARDRRIKPTDVEMRIGTHFTADTLLELRRRCPNMRFVWIMGADNLVGFHRWERASLILRTLPVAIFDRPTYSLRALASRTAHRFARVRLPERMARTLVNRKPPAWVFLHSRRHPASATQIRETRKRLGE